MTVSDAGSAQRARSSSWAHNLRRLLSLKSDQADPDVIDAAVRDSARLGGTNLWVLMLAIAVASVGLNVNSTAVIIGAMLISPLMGPIIGIGYGAAVHDNSLIRSALASLALFVGISLLSSTLYFLLSPLTEGRSEILARTAPTLWDVLIAFFGGTAGMIGLTRREKTTLIPGVAIATALMPPLCTAGFGIATGQPSIFLGAFYLFLINGTFIALASLAVVRLLRLPSRVAVDARAARRRRVVIVVAAFAVLAPSVLLAYRLVQQEVFTANAERFSRGVEQSAADVVLLARDIDPSRRALTLTLMGKGVTPELERTLQDRLPAARLDGATLRIRHPSEAPAQVDALRRDLRRELLQGTASAIDTQSARIDRLEQAQAAMQARFDDAAAAERDIRARLPALRSVLVSASPAPSAGATSRVWVVIDPARNLNHREINALKEWMAARWPGAQVQLVVGRSA